MEPVEHQNKWYWIHTPTKFRMKYYRSAVITGRNKRNTRCFPLISLGFRDPPALSIRGRRKANGVDETEKKKYVFSTSSQIRNMITATVFVTCSEVCLCVASWIPTRVLHLTARRMSWTNRVETSSYQFCGDSTIAYYIVCLEGENIELGWII